MHFSPDVTGGEKDGRILVGEEGSRILPRGLNSAQQRQPSDHKLSSLTTRPQAAIIIRRILVYQLYNIKLPLHVQYCFVYIFLMFFFIIERFCSSRYSSALGGPLLAIAQFAYLIS